MLYFVSMLSRWPQDGTPPGYKSIGANSVTLTTSIMRLVVNLQWRLDRTAMGL